MYSWFNIMCLTSLLFVTSLFSTIASNIDTAVKLQKISTSSQHNTNQSNALPIPQPSAFAVVFVNGLGADKNTMQSVVINISKQFGNKVQIIQFSGWYQLIRSLRSIEKQAEIVFHRIKSDLRKHKRDPRTFPLIIIGESKGGVVACMLGKNYKQQLNIKGIITLNAPLMGAPILGRSSKDVQTFITNARVGLKYLNYCLPIGHAWYIKGMAFLLARFKINGIRDLVPDSNCIKQVSAFIHHDAHTIPCLLMAGYHSDLASHLFKKKGNIHTGNGTIKQFNDAYDQLIVGQLGTYHDGLIPLCSQLCMDGNHNFNNVTTTIYIDRPMAIPPIPSRPHIQRRIYKDIVHGIFPIFRLIVTDLIYFIQAYCL